MKIAIVTGASSGLGKEFVRQLEHFYKELDEIWVIARREEKLQELKKSCSVYVRVFAGDLRKDLIYKQVLNRLENQSPDVRMLVNAAGFGKSGTVEEIVASDKKAQLEMIDVNCRGLTEMILTCLPYFSKGSRIINVASAAAFCPQTTFAVYAATKAYVLSFSRALGAELAPRGIIVTAACPGPVDTEFFQVSGSSGNPLKEATLVKPAVVVRQALLDSKAKKDISVYGKAIKGVQLAGKLLPHSLILNTVDKVNEEIKAHIDEEK